MKNPLPKKRGFNFRVITARRRIKKLAAEPWANIYDRAFDNCFENDDGNAVAWQLTHEALNGDRKLKDGIIAMGGTLWDDWQRHYKKTLEDEPQYCLSI